MALLCAALAHSPKSCRSSVVFIVKATALFVTYSVLDGAEVTIVVQGKGGDEQSCPFRLRVLGGEEQFQAGVSLVTQIGKRPMTGLSEIIKIDSRIPKKVTTSSEMTQKKVP